METELESWNGRQNMEMMVKLSEPAIWVKCFMKPGQRYMPVYCMLDLT